VLPDMQKFKNDYEQQEPLVPQLEHEAPKSNPDVILKPTSRKSTLTGFAFSMNSLFIRYLNPSIS
jgi:hypothetical protein